MDPLFRAAFFAGNRQKLRKQLKLVKNELAIIPAHFKLQKSHDEAHAFVQDSNFYYLTGVREPYCLLILTAKHDLLLSPPIDAHHQLWEGQADINQLKKISGVSDVQAGRKGLLSFKQLVSEAQKVYVPLPYDGRVLRRYYRMVANPARQNLLRRLKILRPDLAVEDLRPIMAQLRMLKQPAEIKAIKEAITITVASVEVARQALPALKTENELQALLEYEFLRRGADGPAFDSIVASGGHTTQIHYMRTGLAPLDKSLILLDIGAQVSGYASDVSQVIRQGDFTKRQQQIYDAVKELQDYAFSLLKPGLSLMDYEDLVDKKSTELTENLRVNRHKTGRRGRRVVPHAISHHLGLDAHDAADYRAPLQAGMVLAVEPGIYLPEEGIGMRLEDDVLITKTGLEILSRTTERKQNGKI